MDAADEVGIDHQQLFLILIPAVKFFFWLQSGQSDSTAMDDGADDRDADEV